MRKIYSLILLCTIVLFASCKEEEPVQVTAVTLDKTTLSLVVGTKGTLTATITPDDAETKDVSWMSCNPAIASVNDKGEVTAVAVGKATVTVITADGGKMANCEVIVTAAPVAVTGITLDKATLSLGAEDKEQLTATIAPEDATNTNVKWTSSDDKIATVSATGEVTAIAAGIATITATTEDGGKTATCIVTVADRPAFKFYGMKNRKVVYYDGVEMKIIGDGSRERVEYGVMINNDFYGVSHYGALYKNGVLHTESTKIPTEGLESVSIICVAGNSFYALGQNKEYRDCYWKDGVKQMEEEPGESFKGMSALENDIFIASSNIEAKRLYAYKNKTKIFDIECPTPTTYIYGMETYNGKVYYITYDGSTITRYVYNGTTFVKDGAVNGTGLRYLANDGTSLFTVITSSDNQLNLYKNVDWETAIPGMKVPENVKTAYYNAVIGEGDNTYIYGRYNTTANSNYEAYCWRNGTDAVRLPADTINVLVHITK